MEIATSTSQTSLRIIYDNNGPANNGPISISASIANTGNTGSSDAVCIMTFKASNAWTGITSKGRNAANNADIVNTGSQGATAKPPTIAIMWILRFI